MLATGTRGGRDTRGGLAVQRLLVERPLAGDHEIGPLQGRREAEHLEQHLDARAERCAQCHQGPEADASRGAGTGGGDRLGGARPGRLLQDLCEVCEGGVQDGDVLLARALLRPVDGRRALLPGQRIVDVARQHDARRLDPRIEARQVGGDEFAQRGAALGDLLAVGVQQPGAERREHPRAAVGRRAAPDPEHDGACTGVQSGPQQFAGAVGRGGQRHQDAPGQSLEPGGLGHLHDGGGVPQGERRGDGRSRRAGHRHLTALEPRGDGGVHGPVSPVGDGQRLDPRTGRRSANAGGQMLGHLHRRERALELVRGDQHTSAVGH